MAAAPTARRRSSPPACATTSSTRARCSPPTSCSHRETWGRPVIELGIDLGTANTVVCDADAGIVLDEPSVLLQTEAPRGRRRIVTVGRDASSLLGRTAGRVSALRPVQDGVIVDIESAETYLRALVRRVARRPWQRARLRAVIGVPARSEEHTCELQSREKLVGRLFLQRRKIEGTAGQGIARQDSRSPG